VFRNAVLGAFVSVGILIFDASVAIARAGGGGGYSSGGGSSSSGSSSYSSGGGSSSGSGTFGFFDGVLLITMIGFAIWISRQKRMADAARIAQNKAISKRAAATLSESDPGFDLNRFLRRVSRAFLGIQDAWSDQDLTTVRSFLSDGLHERFMIQIREQQALGYRNLMSGVEVLEARVLEANRSAHFETVAVEIKARATDYRVDRETGKELAGTRRLETFREVWEFLRASGATTADSGGLFEGRCPNCAAPVAPERAWQCSSCASELSTAPPDWVLVEITQRSEWSDSSVEEIEGFEAFVDRDPGLTVQQIEDRASVLFWRIMDAERTGSTEGLQSTSRPEFLTTHRPRFTSQAHTYVGDCSVGSVELRSLVAGSEWDRALVEVRWAGSPFERLATGAARELNQRELHRSHLILARRTGSQSQIGRCVTSAHCESCGAPDMGTNDASCAFCGALLNDGRDWLIERFVEHGDAAVARFLQAARSEGVPNESSARVGLPPLEAAEPAGLELFAWCLLLVYADAEVERSERERLVSWAETLGISASTSRQMMRAAQFGRLEVRSPKGPVEARRWLASLEAMARADGRLDRREQAVLDDLKSRVAAA
jgi:predicted lipid-binding transport protein (Tim44 family)